MKQAQPADNGGGTPVLSLGAYNGRWALCRATRRGDRGRTTRSGRRQRQPSSGPGSPSTSSYSQDPSKGSITVYVDLNGDGDFADPGEQSRPSSTNTLKYETAGSDRRRHRRRRVDPLPPARGHLPHADIDCPGGCSVDVDNVQVVAPGLTAEAPSGAARRSGAPGE